MHQTDAPSSLVQLQMILSQCGSDVTEASQAAFRELQATIATLQQELQQERAARQQSEKNQLRLQMTIESAADGILAIDSQGKILSINQEFRRQWNVHDLIPTTDPDLLVQTTQVLSDPEQLKRQVQLETDQPTIEGHNILHLKDGRILERFSKPLWLNDEIGGRVISIRNITEQAHKHLTATEVAAQRQAEIELQATQQDLAIRVELRTVELKAANAKLQKEVAQRRAIEQNLRDKQSCLQILNQISQGVTAGLSVDDLIRLAIDQTAARFTTVQVLYGLIDNCQFNAIYSAQPADMPAMRGTIEGLYLTPQYFEIIQKNEPVIVEDVLQEPAFASMVEDMLRRRTRAIALVTVQHSADQVGILAMNAPYPKRWSASGVETIQELADYLSIVLQKVRAQQERAQAEERLKLFESVVVNGNDGVIITDANLENPTIIYVNAAFVQMTGYTAAEAIGKTPRILQGEKTDRSQLTKIRTAMSEGRRIQVELINYRKDRSQYWVDLNVVPIADSSGNLTHFVALQHDITNRKWSEKALIATQARLKYLLSSSPSVIYTCQPNRNRACTFVSENITQEFGYEIWQYLKDPHFWIDHIHPEDLSIVLENLDRLPQVGEITCEYRFLHQDGSYRWLRDSMKLLNDQSIEVIGSVMDISDRKWAEDQIRASLQEKEVMLKEIHHRVKNNLQVVSSLLKLQAGHIQDKRIIEVFKESQNRVSAMALIHEKLYQSEDLAKTHFSEYIHSLATALFRSYSANSRAIQLHLNVQDVRLSIDTAIPCGLIINELVSNSLKYAFSSGETGLISIELHAQEEPSSDSICYHLIVSDNGRGFPPDLDFRNTKSLGLQLVCTLIRQLRGDIALSCDSGVRFTITFCEQKIRV